MSSPLRQRERPAPAVEVAETPASHDLLDELLGSGRVSIPLPDAPVPPALQAVFDRKPLKKPELLDALLRLLALRVIELLTERQRKGLPVKYTELRIHRKDGDPVPLSKARKDDILTIITPEGELRPGVTLGYSCWRLGILFPSGYPQCSSCVKVIA